MAQTIGEISGFSVGDSVDVVRTVTDVPNGTTISKAWLMVKESELDADVSALISKEITSDNAPAGGQITDTGADGIGALLFRIRADDYSVITPQRHYPYGIRVLLANGNLSTLELGLFIARPAVVQAAS